MNALCTGHIVSKQDKAIWTAQDMSRQDGRHAIVTGGVAGIGFQVAKALGAKGAEVLIAGRDAGKGEQALAELRRAVPAGRFAFGRLDLADLSSVAAFADTVLAEGRPVDLLANVAGVMALPAHTRTADGFEMHMGTNHLGHFALTGRLLPALKAGRNARVVAVSAKVASWARLDLADLQSEKKYSPMGAYSRSKLADVLFAVELNRRGVGLGISGIAVDPGTARTSLQRHAPRPLRWAANKLIDVIGYPLDQVADPVLYAATVAVAGPETYVGPTRFIMSKGSPGYIGMPAPARDARLREQLWARSEALTGVSYAFS